MLVLHPDTLLTATSLSNSTQCTRKPLLSSLVRSSNDITPALVWGNMLHEIMQRCLLSSTFTDEYIEEQIDSVVLDGLGSLVVLNISEETARATLRARTQHLPDFAERYLGETPKPEGTVSDTRAKNGDAKSTLAIKRVHEVEEDIWSPKYGLKGKLDVTLEVVVDEEGRGAGLPVAPSGVSRTGFFKAGKQTTLPSMKPLQSHPRPFEIKTGRSIGGMEHRAQTMLYTLLASERYGVEVDKGLLFYTQSDSGEIVQVSQCLSTL
ncbi:DNA replication factor Dna2-domain-containing protein [Coprinopsis sp. MPI-PUGE-AT-0042]|nr:DNA replication factor Dna2-domain-containing protein [Coprinopsis sp. MPI-PUGE-AT-0042]